MKRYHLVLWLFISWSSFGQSVKCPSPVDIPGVSVNRSDSFSGQNLSKYLGTRINLCMEYGLQQMYVIDYLYNEDKARMEVYMMEDALSALGLYSVTSAGCLFWKLYSTFSCKGPEKTAAAAGPYFFNILNLNRTGSGQQLCERIIQSAIAGNPQESLYIPLIFQHQQLTPYINSLKYMEGPVGISLGAPQMTEILESLSFRCFTVNIINPKYSGILARIEFPDFSNLDSFIIQAGLNRSGATTPTIAMNGAYRSWYKIDDTKLIYLECSSPELKLTDLIPEKPSPMY